MGAEFRDTSNRQVTHATIAKSERKQAGEGRAFPPSGAPDWTAPVALIGW
jgi:hypothetical protein